MVEGRGGGPTDHATIKQWASSDPEDFQPLIDLLTEAITQFLERQIEAGPEAIQLFESWAGILPDPFFELWCVRPVAAIVKALRAKYPATPIIAFPRGAGLQYDGYVEATAVDSLGLDSTVPLAWGADVIQARLGRCVQGNLDNQILVAGGSTIHTEAQRILAALSGGPFIFNLGHGILKTTPPEYVDALVRQVQSWRAQ
jgi:uroporphyrinogen decarboxylase